jgi:hypothetical protein
MFHVEQFLLSDTEPGKYLIQYIVGCRFPGHFAQGVQCVTQVERHELNGRLRRKGPEKRFKVTPSPLKGVPVSDL